MSVLLSRLPVVAALAILPGMAAAQCTIEGPLTVACDGTTYRTIDDRGVYFVDLAAYEQAHPGIPLPEVPRTLDQGYGPRASIEPVVVELVDYIDCSGTSHSFFHGAKCNNPNNPSRLLTVGGRTFRVTGELFDNFKVTFYHYDFKTSGRAGEPHLLVAESVNDRERYTSIAINALDAQGWAPPYEGEPDINPWGDPWWQANPRRTQQGPVFEPDVGLMTYTGREFPTTGERFNVPVLFFSKSATMRVVVASERMTESPAAADGGAVSRMWVFRIATPLDAPVVQPPAAPAEERRFGLYFPHTWYLLCHYGTPVRTAAQRQDNYRRLCDYLRYCGFNWLEFNAINGSDRTDHSWYTGGGHFPSTPAADLLAELPPVAAERGIGLLPVITSLKEPKEFLGISWTDSSYQRNTNGDFTRAFGNPLPDPLRPEVQQVMFNLIDEIATRTVDATAVKGIGVRVSGKIGLCYAAHQDGWRGAKLSGYSSWHLQQFKNDTGSAVPTGSPSGAYDWLQARPNEWKAWIDWRCARMRTFWLAMRDRVRSHRPDWELYIKCVLPSEVPGTNIEWANTTPIELLREAGYDPALYTGDEGIVIQRGMMIAEDRYFSRARWNEPWGRSHSAYKRFHYAEGLPEVYATAAGRACELYHNYIEESWHPYNEYGQPCGEGGFRTTTPAAVGRNFFEPIAMSLRRQNADTLTLMGWNRASLGHEHALRRWGQAYRALPAVAPAPIAGSVSPAVPEVQAAWYGDRLAVINDAAAGRTITLTFDAAFAPGEELVEVGSGKLLLSAAQHERRTLSLEAEAWSLYTYVRSSTEPVATHTPTPGPSESSISTH